MSLKISVALCTFNGESYLNEQLESIRNQTASPYELVVCDDGSQDGTIAILQEFARVADFPVYLHRNDSNLGSTRNFEKAIGLCQGDLIALCDQDDVWMSDKLEKIGNIFGSNPKLAAVFSDAVLINLIGDLLGDRLWARAGFTPTKQRSFHGSAAVRQLIDRDLVTGATVVFRSRFVAQLVPFAVDWVHDGWIALILACIAEIRPIPDVLIQYRLHPRQQIGAHRQSLADRLFTNKEQALRFHLLASKRWSSMALKLNSLLVDQTIVSNVSQKSAFFEKRAALLEQPRWRRVWVATKMLIEYVRFDKGILSYLRDLAH